jgi:hypothetical protein
MTLLDLILNNFDKDSPEVRFSEIISKDYESKFGIEDFDTKFDGVAGYKPIRTAISDIAKSYIDTYDLNDSDNDYVMTKFREAYDDVTDKTSINIQAIVDGIVNDLDFDDPEEDIDFESKMDDESEDFDDDIDFDDE